MTKDYSIQEDGARILKGSSVSYETRLMPGDDIHTILLNRISWAAVFAGVATALAAQLVLNLIGVGVGAASLEATTTATATETVNGFSLGAAIWWGVAGILASYAGGFTAGRLSGEPSLSTAGWCGLVSWAVSILLVAALMTTAAGVFIGGPFQVVVDAGMIQAFEGADTASAVAIQGDAAATAPATGDTTTVNAASVSVSAIFAALTLVLGACAAWFGGRAGTITGETVVSETNLEKPLHWQR